MRYLALLFLFSTASHLLYAQNYSTNLVGDKLIKQISQEQSLLNSKSPVRFGFTAGVNFSNMNFNKGYPTPSEPISSSWKTGFIEGLFMEVPVQNNFCIQPEYMYLYIKGEHATLGEAYTMSYVSLPVLFKYKFAEKFAVMAGPQFDLLINANKKANGIRSSITHDTEERSIGAVGGLEFSFTESLSLNARYIHGLNHIGIGQRSDVKEFKFEMARLTASLKF